MRRVFKRQRVWLACCVLASGCQSISDRTQPWDEARWNDLLQQHHYRTALAVLERKPQLADYQALLERLHTATARHRQWLIREVERLTIAGEHVQADALLAESEGQLLPSPEFDRFRAEYLVRLRQMERAQLTELFLLRGNYLLAERQRVDRLSRLARSRTAQRELSRHETESEAVAAHLLKAGERALAVRDYRTAINYLSVATKLDDDGTADVALKEARRALTRITDRQRNLLAQAQEQEYDKRRAAVEGALARANFRAALDELAALRQIASQQDTGTTRELADKVHSSVERFVQTEVRSGDQRYAEGRIEQALRHWRSAHSVGPSEELAAKIDKAERFLERYRELKLPEAQTAAERETPVP